MSDRGRTALSRCVVAAVLIALALAARRNATAPTPTAAPGPGDFNLDAAVAFVRENMTAPRPNGSEENARVRGLIVEHLRSLGLQVDVLQQRISGHRLHNIVARLPGTGGGGRAILLAAHYDSVPWGPGASDDGAAVAALLETARALKVGSPLRQDVVFLISDGEEFGLLGARAWAAAEGELTPKYSLALNFEARGTAGPSLMFETRDGNLSVVRHLSNASPRPLANSLSYDVYKLLRNDTDFSVFKRMGLQGLNFAFIGNYFWYHTPDDSPANLDPRSLYHHGLHALALARHFGNLSDEELASIASKDQPNGVYFNLTPSVLIVYPATWVWPLFALQTLFSGWAIVRAFRRREASGRGQLGAFARLVLALLLSAGAAFALGKAFTPPVAPGAYGVQLAAIVGTCATLTALIALPFRRRTSAADLIVAGVVLLTLLSVPVNLYVPGGSFLTLWPAAFASLGVSAASVRGVAARAVLCVLAASAAVIVFVPMTELFFAALTLKLAAALSAVVVIGTWVAAAAVAPVLSRGGEVIPAGHAAPHRP